MRNAYLEEIRGWDMPIRLLDDSENPFAKSRVKIHAICGFQSPNYVTMKAGMMCWMLEDAKNAGKLNGVECFIEASSGATGLVLPMLARDEHFGIPHAKVVIVMNANVPDGKRYPIVYAGAEVMAPIEGMTTVATARHLGGGGWSEDEWEPSSNGWLNLDQYANPANPNAYRDYVAPQILRKMQPHGFKLLVCPVGTGGTIVGLEEGCREGQDGLSIVGAMSIPGQTISGMRSRPQMVDIRFPWEKAADRIIEVESLHAKIAALQTIQNQNGMMMGFSAGAAYVATLLALKEHKRNGTLDSLRSEVDGYVHAVFVAHDGLRTYTANKMPELEEYIADPKKGEKMLASLLEN